MQQAVCSSSCCFAAATAAAPPPSRGATRSSSHQVHHTSCSATPSTSYLAVAPVAGAKRHIKLHRNLQHDLARSTGGAGAFARGLQRQHRPSSQLAALPSTTAATAAVTASAGGGEQHDNNSSGSSSSSQQQQPVAVAVEKAPNNSRRLFAEIGIAAPPGVVWDALTDYDRLHEFIPSLETNRCLERRATGARLEQVGAQEVALGVKFSARVVLDIHEFAGGMPDDLCSAAHDEARFPHPAGPDGGGAAASTLVEAELREEYDAPGGGGGSPVGGGGGGTAAAAPPPSDIAFSMVESRDFQAFRGVWRVAQGPSGPDTAVLSYALFVRPQVWLPVQLVQSRIEGEVRNNLNAVRAYAEGLHLRGQGGGVSSGDFSE